MHVDPWQVGVNIVETLHPGGALVYSWDEPLGERSVVIERLTRAPSGLGVGVGLAETAASGQQSARSFTAGSTVVGVYALDITRPSSIVGGLRVGATGDVLGGEDSEEDGVYGGWEFPSGGEREFLPCSGVMRPICPGRHSWITSCEMTLGWCDVRLSR